MSDVCHCAAVVRAPSDHIAGDGACAQSKKVTIAGVKWTNQAIAYTGKKTLNHRLYYLQRRHTLIHPMCLDQTEQHSHSLPPTGIAVP